MARSKAKSRSKSKPAKKAAPKRTADKLKASKKPAPHAATGSSTTQAWAPDRTDTVWVVPVALASTRRPAGSGSPAERATPLGARV